MTGVGMGAAVGLVEWQSAATCVHVHVHVACVMWVGLTHSSVVDLCQSLDGNTHVKVRWFSFVGGGILIGAI